VSGLTGWCCHSPVQRTKGSALADQCLRPGDRIGPYELSQRFGAHRVIHRNIKPSNILMDEASQVQLLDFGVAKRLEPYGLLTGRPPYRSAKTLASDPTNSPVARSLSDLGCACCGRPPTASFGDRFPYIVPGYARKRSPLIFIRHGCSLWVALATAIPSPTGS
jgi:serine/threonine protein kinase